MKFDTLVIGGGQAGIPLAVALVKAGQTVALAERKYLGGSCVNFGCTPTKAVIASARLAHDARRAVDYGLKIPEVEVDFAAVLERAKTILLDSRDSLQDKFEGDDALTLLRGHARLTGKGDDGFQITVGDEQVTAARVVLNTGTRSLIPQVEGLEALDFIHSGNWLEHATLPEHLIILGGGYIGLEMSQFYRRMGARVTVVESGAQVAAHEDEDVAAKLQEVLEAEDIVFELGAKAKKVSREGGVTLTFERDGQEGSVQGSHLFVATGRKPNTDDLGLETVSVETDDKGIIEVDERLATNVEGIWVAGDIRGGPMFTHTAYDDYRVLESQLVGDGSHTTNRVVPYGMFVDPQLGRVGMTEREARDAGKTVQVACYDMKSNGRAREEGRTGGFIKVVVDTENDRLLGAAVIAAEGAEMVHTYITLMNANVPYSVARDAVFVHPTYSEGIQSVLKKLSD
ncbi:mercuric reductase [soil metagenome]